MTVVASICIMPLFLVIHCAGARGAALPLDCVRSTPPTLRVSCRFRDLTAVPDGIPPDVVRISLSNNKIRSVPHLPFLKLVTSVDLSRNLIETVSWVSLRNLPALGFLYLGRNRIKFFDFGFFVSVTRALAYVDLSHNQISSVAKPQIGTTQRDSLGMLSITHNPFHCDCKIKWLIDKLACLQACGAGHNHDIIPCCRSCEGCHFLVYTKMNDLTCGSPTQLQTLPLWNVSGRPLECQDSNSSVANSTKRPVLQAEHEGAESTQPGSVQGNNSLSRPATSWSSHFCHSSPSLHHISNTLSPSITLQTLSISESLEHTTNTIVNNTEYFGHGDVSSRHDVSPDNIGHTEASKTPVSTTGPESAWSGSIFVATIVLGTLIGVLFICFTVYQARRVFINRQTRNDVNGTRRVYILPAGYPVPNSTLNAISGQVQQSFDAPGTLSTNLQMVPMPRRLSQRTPPVGDTISQMENLAAISSLHNYPQSIGASVRAGKSDTKGKKSVAFPGPNVASSVRTTLVPTGYSSCEHYPPQITEDPDSHHVYEYLP
ncbi:PREDICTED: leucine-rich repeat transmembrane protein FLRT3-like [Branchiostoma belcheri]|uniref:Leucine-rich repeat transmembrane protein FLRT3-like n=1 Tax=Branchiostoma belcheri TaxID=7741 RepID=A0A6P4ZCE3_BRABE|nr:PREDICTED: leucine-rich repeat transmembrane protein FLRT3-like [Branchiostoma belcheri]